MAKRLGPFPRGRCRFSTSPLLLEADEPPVPDDHVVQKVDAEELGGLRGVPGQLHVLRGGRRVAGGMETAMLVVAMLIDGANIATSGSLL